MRTLCALAALLALTLLSPARADKDKKDFAHVGDLNAEVTVLNVLHALDLTPAQAETMAKLAAKTMQAAPPRKMVKVSDAFKKTLAGLREALVKHDDEKVDELFAKFDELRQKEDPEFDEIEVTDAARAETPRVVGLLSARQVANYIASIPDFPDPVERLTDAMEAGRKLTGKEWQGLRDDIAYQVGYLVAGLDAKADEKVRDRAAALLNKAQGLGEKAYAGQKAALEKEARELVGKVGPTDVIRHFMERVVAETLSSHRLEAALEARAKKK